MDIPVLFIGPLDAVDLYAEGTSIFSITVENTPPRESGEMVISSVIEEGDEDYDLIKKGEFRIGIRINLEHEELQLVNVHYSIESLELELSGYPFGFI